MSVPVPTSIPTRRNEGAPALLGLGACILLYRTIALLAGEGRTVLKRWVVGLTLAEMAVDVVTVLGAVRWRRAPTPAAAQLALRAGAFATVLHAVRVLVFVLGRTGPWADIDVRPEHRADHRRRWSWAEVWFAGVMSTLGIIGVVVVWLTRRRSSNPPTRRHRRSPLARVA